MGKYAIGVDYGTQACRALLVDVVTGEEIGSKTCPYPHGVMEKKLDDVLLGTDWALQDPRDYLYCLEFVTKGVIKDTGIDPEQVIGVGVDFTACTILPIDKEGTPLAMYPKYEKEPHAYVKLWKHHAAQPYADRLNEIAMERKEEFLDYLGGQVSSEWLVPKVMQLVEEAPEIYNEADQIIEAGDWIVACLTGEYKRSSCQAGYKGLYSKKRGYPSKDFFKALDPRLENLVEDKLPGDIYPIGDCAGTINEKGAELTGLPVGVAVGVANIDAHVAVPAAGIHEENQMLLIMGTSTCHMVVSKEEKLVPGISGIVEDGILPGYFGYEAGQACVGDHFNWLVQNMTPKAYEEEAKSLDQNIHTYLTNKARELEVGESGLLALDWWNGVRSVLDDSSLSGLLIGATLTTKPEEVYRALIEATAYGTRKIVETFEENGIEIKELYASGGIASKNDLMMQIYADVTGKPVRICGSEQPVALGAAMYGAVAASEEDGGYKDIFEASKVMARLKDQMYEPIKENQEAYEELYKEYDILHDYFGRGGNNVMKRLKAMKHRVYTNKK